MKNGIAVNPASPRIGLLGKLRALRIEAKQTLKHEGLKGLFRRYGWKLFAFLFAYYLVRDLTIYIVLPWLIAKHLMAD